MRPAFYVVIFQEPFLWNQWFLLRHWNYVGYREKSNCKSNSKTTQLKKNKSFSFFFKTCNKKAYFSFYCHRSQTWLWKLSCKGICKRCLASVSASEAQLLAKHCASSISAFTYCSYLQRCMTCSSCIVHHFVAVYYFHREPPRRYLIAQDHIHNT